MSDISDISDKKIVRGFRVFDPEGSVLENSDIPDISDISDKKFRHVRGFRDVRVFDLTYYCTRKLGQLGQLGKLGKIFSEMSEMSDSSEFSSTLPSGTKTRTPRTIYFSILDKKIRFCLFVFQCKITVLESNSEVNLEKYNFLFYEN